MRRRQVLAEDAAWLRELGFLIVEIADALGISRSYASDLLIDPDGEKAKQRKQRYASTCVDCGRPTSGSEGRKPTPRCHGCAAARTGRAAMKWTPEVLLARIREWNDLYGEPPAMNDWNPWQARHFLHDEARARRFEAADGYWPWFTHVVDRFGSWAAAIEAAGFTPREPFHSFANAQRRRSIRGEVRA